MWSGCCSETGGGAGAVKGAGAQSGAEAGTRRAILHFDRPVAITCSASCGGKAEHDGPLGEAFDHWDPTDRFGADTWELAESQLAALLLNLALAKANLAYRDVDLLFAGDLQNQCVATSGGLSPFGIPYFGLYGACSTCCEGLLLAAISLNAAPSGTRAAVVTTSHNCAAERQFRLPLEYGGQRAPTAQWTATAGGCFLLECMQKGQNPRNEDNHRTPPDTAPDSAADGAVDRIPCITQGMAGRIVDAGIRDASNMGAAMAPAAADTLIRYFRESGETPMDFDAIVTGDLGQEGTALLCQLTARAGYRIDAVHRDCGLILFDRTRQDVHAGGSGCGCSASVMACHFLPLVQKGRLSRMLFLATGALMSPSSLQQGGAICGIAPLILIEGNGA